MGKKRTIRLVERPSFTNWAIIIVTTLIVITGVGIASLMVVLADGGTDLSTLARPETAAQSTPTPRPTRFVWETPSPQSLSLPTAVPAKNLPTRPAKTTGGDTAVSAGTGETGYAHPTYQPTTEPCQSCHEEMGQGQ